MGRRLAKRASNRIKELNERRLDSSISREKCVQCAWFLYTFLPVLFYFYLSPPPPMQFSALCKQKSAAKKKGEKKKQNKRIVSLFRTGKNFYRFFFSPSLPHFDNFDSFFQLVLSFDKMGKLASINSRVESHYSVRDMICSSYWRGERGGAQSLTGMPVLFVQPTLNEICTVYSLSRGKWR